MKGVVVLLATASLLLSACTTSSKAPEAEQLILSIRPIKSALSGPIRQPDGLFMYLRSDGFLTGRIYHEGQLARTFGDSDSSRQILQVISRTDLSAVHVTPAGEVHELDANGNEVVVLPPFDGVEVEITVNLHGKKCRLVVWNPGFYLEHPDAFPGIRGLKEILDRVFHEAGASEVGI